MPEAEAEEGAQAEASTSASSPNHLLDWDNTNEKLILVSNEPTGLPQDWETLLLLFAALCNVFTLVGSRGGQTVKNLCR